MLDFIIYDNEGLSITKMFLSICEMEDFVHGMDKQRDLETGMCAMDI